MYIIFNTILSVLDDVKTFVTFLTDRTQLFKALLA